VSLKKSGLKIKITVVDNASTDGTKELIQEHFPSVHHIVNSDNVGLSRSLNIGIREGLDYPYTLLLNDDVELFPETITLMLNTLESHTAAMGIPARLIYPDGRPQRVKLKIIGVEKAVADGVQYIEFGGTTACLYKTDIFRQIGLFDEFYFFYNEDLDFSLKAKRRGIKFVFNPEIKVIHHRKKGRTKALKAIKPYYYATNYYFYRKNYGIFPALLYLQFACIHMLIWKNRFKRENENENLRLLIEGGNKLMHTVRNYKKLQNVNVSV
jgi:GT2 family glycosyltransferase